MATLDMQNTAQLAESRRKMQARRRMKNRIALTLSMATMAFGLFWLIWILMSTITRGIDGMSLALFTEMTPPPNTAGGGLANALAGSGLLILWATVLGTPLGIMAGIYLAEYGRKSWLAEIIRFINDILLSAPSIVVGLFVYTIVVAQMQPIANLPVTIFKFAMSPFAEWQQLAWAGVLIITLCVLLLNILARVVFAKKKHG
ncbi:TPA: hypothetical protein ACGBOR_004174 [Salmonella enterica subsp. enterica serovar Dublin]